MPPITLKFDKCSCVVPTCKIGIWLRRQQFYVYKAFDAPQGLTINKMGGLSVSFASADPAERFRVAKACGTQPGIPDEAMF